jgi:hypothetical protein
MKTKRTIFVWLLSSLMTIALSAQNVAKYELESAIIQKEVVMMKKMNTTLYSNWFGQEESIEVPMVTSYPWCVAEQYLF